MPYVSVEHEPGFWVDAHVEKQWKHAGRWRLAVYYFVDAVQYYRVFDADQIRSAISAERLDAATVRAHDAGEVGASSTVGGF